MVVVIEGKPNLDCNHSSHRSRLHQGSGRSMTTSYLIIPFLPDHPFSTQFQLRNHLQKLRMLTLFSRPFHLSRSLTPVLYYTTSRSRYRRATAMTRGGNLDISPPIHRGMKDRLDRDLFKKSIPVLGVKVAPEKVHTTLRSEKIRKYVTRG